MDAGLAQLIVDAIGLVDDVAHAALILARWSFGAALVALVVALVALARTDRSKPTC